jgi:DNA polymerase III delta prime subunit
VPVGVPYQIIFLDEADELTREAQTALRNHAETNGYNKVHSVLQLS